MSYTHENLFIMIPYLERARVEGYFNLDLVGEDYAKLLGDLTDSLAEYIFRETDKGNNTVIIPILRAGISMSSRLNNKLPKATVAQINMRRNLNTLKPFVAWDEFEEIDNPKDKIGVITDPALATGGSISKTIESMLKYGFKEKNIIVMSMFGCATGLEKIFSKYPMVKIYLVHLADGIGSNGYLLPDNGDTGDRLYGKRENEFLVED